jgi:hypothetical protein
MDRVARWCEHHLGSAPREELFRADHLSDVRGLELEDGRRVVLKLRGRQERLVGCAAVHRAVWAAGIPCPEPLAGPLPLAADRPDTWVSAEAWVDAEERVPDDPPTTYARVLARIVSAAPDAAGLPLDPPVPWLWYDHDEPGRTWPPPASERWDPHRIESSLPAHVVEVARRARARLLAGDVRALPVVAGHADLSGHNTTWLDDRAVVHDWDSVVAAPEAVLAGSSAADCMSHEESRLASIAEMERYLAAYAEARGRAWTADEVEIVHATGAWVAAYDAAFEHLGDGPHPRSERLGVDGNERLERAGA